ncbi:RNA-binding transcriptional accessory protein [Veillonella atypica]|uniref:Tex family protein n=1 Tax=Veillonella TaxID=29465 RepID=UPI001D08C84B|nr:MULTISPECIES: Tex family protein [Veillonella]MCB6515710.1 RNA-binding transcriptional accessory protein [Veillonella atypica]MCG4863357.1 RNA-binding transcriptional accessory protein [Veillonella atypica]MDU3604143.1 Tex family protein [Veillonella sp.]
MESMFAIIAKELGVKTGQVEAAVTLLDEGNTVPFIARYRKEVTGELQDEQLRTVEERIKYLRNLETRRQEIINAITEQDKMTDELMASLMKAVKLQELEDLYLPYRPKKRTRAMIARERGLEPLADMILNDTVTSGNPLDIAKEYVSEEVPTPEDAIQGASDIVAEIVSDSADFRATLRKRMWKEGFIQAELVEDNEHKDQFLQYNEYAEPVRQMPSHRILAVNRGEKLGALKLALTVPDESYIQYMVRGITKSEQSIFSDVKASAVADAYKRLMFPALERDIRNELTESADEQAIKVFGVNLKNLLLQPPLAGHVIMGLDPGYRTGCKMAIIDAQGNVLDYGAYYLTNSEKLKQEAQKKLAEKIRKFKVTLLSIGNGTASYETEQFASKMIEEEKLDCHYIITNEAGASVYSASKLAIDELPDLDVTIRGAVSIARRVQDPLAESVKIDPKSIGVGQYQHDVNQKQLSHTLDQVVESVVNHVGVELNTASPAILQHIAGISSTVAKNIVAFRQDNGGFTSRKQLLKVPRLGPAAFTQCAGFLRLNGANNPLDNTSVHPESYELAERIIGELGFTLKDLQDKSQLEALQVKLPLVDVDKMAHKLDAGIPTVRDIIAALAKPGRDPREDLPAPLTRKHVVSLEDIKVGTVVKGTVHNVVDFGAFIDFGLKTNGLLHRSELCTAKQHPSDVLAVGDIIEAEIISVDVKRNRIGLSVKSLRNKDKKKA